MTFAPLHYSAFRAIWVASFISNFGTLIESIGASWLMTSIGSSASMVALVQVAATLPMVLFSLLAGAIADNFDRRALMLIAFSAMLGTSAALSAVTWLGIISPWLLLAFTFAIGCVGTFVGPAWQSSVSDMLPRSEIPAAVVLNSMAFNIARTTGPALGGLIVAVFGAAAAFAANALSYVSIIAVLARWRPPVVDRALSRETLGTAMGAGIRYVAMAPDIRNVLFRSSVFGVGVSAIPALLPLVGRAQSGGNAFSYGVMLGAFGVGALGGAISIGRLSRRFQAETIVCTSFALFALSALVIASSPFHLLLLVALAIGGTGWVLGWATFTVAVQLSAPRWVEARAIALFNMASFAGLAGGSWLWGAVADGSSIGSALFAAGMTLIMGIVIGIRLPMPKTDVQDKGPIRRWSTPGIALDIEPRSGPIAVSIEYRVREDKLPAFLSAMAELRYARLRNGARRWSLFRDLSDPDLWVESYQSPTWLEYLRHNQRRSETDGAISDRLLALHQGPDAPVVRRMIERQTRWPPAQARKIIQPASDPQRPF